MDSQPIIDAHHHFWQMSMNRHTMFNGPIHGDFFLGDYSTLRRDYLPADYRRDWGGHNVLASVHCEAEWDRDDQYGETEWLAGLARAEGLPTALVGHAWLHTDNAENVLRRQAAHPLVRGIRSKPKTTQSPGTLPEGTPGSMSDPAWRQGLRLLASLGLSYDLRVPLWHLEESAEVIRLIPETPVVLNHTGFPWDRSADGMALWRRSMRLVAAEPNTVVKLSEFGLKNAPWDYDENRVIVHEAIDIFGPERCMFASNFPVAGLRIGFAELYDCYKRMAADYTSAERHALFCGTAARVYRIAVSETSIPA